MNAGGMDKACKSNGRTFAIAQCSRIQNSKCKIQNFSRVPKICKANFGTRYNSKFKIV